MLKHETNNPVTSPARTIRLVTGLSLLAAALVLAGTSWRVVSAATYQGPTAQPPNGNIPLTIWNRTVTTGTQLNAAIAIDGGGPATTSPVGVAVGSATLDLGSAAGGNNIYYGVADYTKMNATDELMKLQTYSGGIYTDRLTVDRDGLVTVSGGLETTGSVHGSGCVGKTFIGLTKTGGESNNGHYRMSYLLSTYPGGGYGVVNNRCNADYPGSHVCRSDEILESFTCSKAGDPIRLTTIVPDGTPAWIVAGPPGYAALANDCVGWTSASSSAYGRVWFFDSVKGGSGGQTTCSMTIEGLSFACCR